VIAVHPLILALDTASSCSSVSLSRGGVEDGELLAEFRLNSRVTHSRRLLSGVEWILKENQLSFGDLDAFAVGLGPGSFTGLRIAMATVKGLAAASEKPLLGVSTLDALAFHCSGDRPLCVLLDARKKEVYRRWYSSDAAGRYHPDGDIGALSPEDLLAEVRQPVLMAGDGLLTYGEYLTQELGEKLRCAPLSLHYPSAAAIAFLCCEEFRRGNSLDTASAAPLYVRASDAELNLRNKEEQASHTK